MRIEAVIETARALGGTQQDIGRALELEKIWRRLNARKPDKPDGTTEAND